MTNFWVENFWWMLGIGVAVFGTIIVLALNHSIKVERELES